MLVKLNTKQYKFGASLLDDGYRYKPLVHPVDKMGLVIHRHLDFQPRAAGLAERQHTPGGTRKMRVGTATRKTPAKSRQRAC